METKALSAHGSPCQVGTVFEGMHATLIGSLPFILIIAKYYLAKHAKRRRDEGVSDGWFSTRVRNRLASANERRALQAFGYDVLKQVLAQAVLHLCNLVISTKFVGWLPAKLPSEKCVVYWFCTVADDTVGLVFLSCLMCLTVRQQYYIEWAGSHFGDYRGDGHKMSLFKLSDQLLVWLVLVVLMRAFMFLLTCALSGFIFDWSNAFLHFCIHRILGGSPGAETFLVKTVTPVIFNTLQIYWIDRLIQAPDEVHSMPILQSVVESNQQEVKLTKEDIKKLSPKFGQLTEKDLDVIWKLEKLKEENQDVPMPENVRKALEANVSLFVNLFRVLDVGENGQVRASDFKRVCTQNRDMAKLFDVPDEYLDRPSRERQNLIVKYFGRRINKNKRGPASFHKIVGFFQDRDKRELMTSLEALMRPGVAGNNAGEPNDDAVDEGKLAAYKQSLKWCHDDLPEDIYNPAVAAHCSEFYNSQNNTRTAPATATDPEQPMLVREEDLVVAGSGPRPQDCVGPAVPYMWVGVLLNSAAFAFMPMVALGTMECKEGGGFADHSSILSFIFDGLFLGFFVVSAFWLQYRIVQHTLIWQLPTIKRMDVFGFYPSRYSWKYWVGFMAIFSFLNQLNVWTNAEVLGRVLATFQYCPEADQAISDTWRKVIEHTWFYHAAPWAVSILTLSTVLYLPIFLQPVFAFLFGATFDLEVGYKVGKFEDEKHDNYWTMWQPMEGAQVDHHSLVQVFSALVSYEAVNFADYQRNRDLMTKFKKVAQTELNEVENFGKQLMDAPVEDVQQTEAERVDQERECRENHARHCRQLFQAVDDYYKTLQQEIQKSMVAKLVLVGLFQNALQTKVQITMFSLNYTLTNDVDILFLVGVVGNLAGYFISIVESILLVMLLYDYVNKDEFEMRAMLQSDYVLLKYWQFDVRKHRRTRLVCAYCFGGFFVIIYIAFWLYCLVNFIMVFECNSHVWNISLWPPDGCAKVPHLGNMTNINSTNETNTSELWS